MVAAFGGYTVGVDVISGEVSNDRRASRRVFAMYFDVKYVTYLPVLRRAGSRICL